MLPPEFLLNFRIPFSLAEVHNPDLLIAIIIHGFIEISYCQIVYSNKYF